MEDKLWTEDPTQHLVLVCRLCGDEWKFPLPTYEYLKNEVAMQWECPNCRRRLHGVRKD